MTAFRDVEQFVRAANRSTRMEELTALLSGAVEALGFDHVALVHHVNISTSPSEAVQYVDYPDAWKQMNAERGYFSDDPVLAACQTSAAAFIWSDLPNIIQVSPRQAEILESASLCGLGEGFTVPINVPGEFLGSCSYAVREGRDLPRPSLPAAQYVACFAFEAARRIRRADQDRSARPKLTGRQYDCLVLAAQGKSDWHIGQLLGISGDTVHQHIEAAKKRYGVASRTQLVVRALFDSQITFGDVIP